MPWKILRARRVGVRLSDLVVARNVARSLAFHSHSRLRQEVERRREHVGVQRRLDLEHLRAVIAHHLAEPPHALVQLALVTVHQAAGVLQRLGVVVEAEAAVAGQTRW